MISETINTGVLQPFPLKRISSRDSRTWEHKRREGSKMKYLDERLKSLDTSISEILLLPSRFIFGVITPLYFVESVGGATMKGPSLVLVIE